MNALAIQLVIELVFAARGDGNTRFVSAPRAGWFKRHSYNDVLGLSPRTTIDDLKSMGRCVEYDPQTDYVRPTAKGYEVALVYSLPEADRKSYFIARNRAGAAARSNGLPENIIALECERAGLEFLDTLPDIASRLQV